jgi:hypothetical protein
VPVTSTRASPDTRSKQSYVESSRQASIPKLEASREAARRRYGDSLCEHYLLGLRAPPPRRERSAGGAEQSHPSPWFRPQAPSMRDEFVRLALSAIRSEHHARPGAERGLTPSAWHSEVQRRGRCSRTMPSDVRVRHGDPRVAPRHCMRHAMKFAMQRHHTFEPDLSKPMGRGRRAPPSRGARSPRQCCPAGRRRRQPTGGATHQCHGFTA